MGKSFKLAADAVGSGFDDLRSIKKYIALIAEVVAMKSMVLGILAFWFVAVCLAFVYAVVIADVV
jgi:hypothetical protein